MSTFQYPKLHFYSTNGLKCLRVNRLSNHMIMRTISYPYIYDEQGTAKSIPKRVLDAVKHIALRRGLYIRTHKGQFLINRNKIK